MQMAAINVQCGSVTAEQDENTYDCLTLQKQTNQWGEAKKQNKQQKKKNMRNFNDLSCQ